MNRSIGRAIRINNQRAATLIQATKITEQKSSSHYQTTHKFTHKTSLKDGKIFIK